MIDKFPKIRKELPDAYQKIYVEHYSNNRNGSTAVSSISMKLESWMHKMVATTHSNNCTTLEIGAGTLNQLDFEKKSKQYDIIEPFEILYKDSKNISSIDNFFSDIFQIPDHKKYDRIISIATFEHICNLPEVIAKAINLFADSNSILGVAIPSEGYFLWKLAYTMTSGIAFKRKYNLDYATLMNYEHVNTAKEIEFCLRYFFYDIKKINFGLSNQLSLYQYFECKNPKVDVISCALCRKK